MTNNHEEHYMQVAVIEQVNILCAMQRPDLLLMGRAPVQASPNASRRTPRQGAWMKAEGMLAGWPDLEVFYPNVKNQNLYIEMKTEKGKLSDSQFECLTYLELCGHDVAICRTVEDAVDKICKHLGLRAKRI